jgi:prefoldin beta subunit
MDKDTENQIKELQSLEQTLQSLMMQKQAFQLELSETENALAELEKSSGNSYKITGNIMIPSSKEQLIKDSKHKKELLELRLKSIEKQEKQLAENSDKLREKVFSKMNQQ